MGDFLAAIPLVHILNRTYPDASIHLSGPESWIPIAGFIPFLKVVPYARFELWRVLSGDPHSISELTRHLKSFDRVFWFTDPQSELGRFLDSLNLEGLRCRTPFPGPGRHISIYNHVADIIGDPSAGATLNQLKPPLLDIPGNQHNPDHTSPDSYRLIWHPGSGGARKRWRVKNGMNVIRRIAEDYGLKICVLLGPAEMDMDFGRFTTLVEFWRDLPIDRLACKMSGQGFYLGNDSGISHLAGLLGHPGIVMFDQTDMSVWKPWGSTLQAVHFSTAPEIVTRLLGQMIIDKFARIK